MVCVTTSELQNNFGKYLNMIIEGDEIVIMKNGKKVACMISYDKSIEFLSNQLIGVLKKDYDLKEEKEERMKKYEGTN